MKSLVFICPYFGKLPREQMELWLQTCKYNSTIDWYVYTDDQTEYQYPSNVKAVYVSFDKMKERIQSKFQFPISLERPYKLCDYKPAYGYIFEEDITGYEYWGHCDMSDSLFGNLRLFLTDEKLMQADKTLFWGHMSIYRNDPEVNRRFMMGSGSTIRYQDVFQNPENMCFDEVHEYSIDAIYKYHGIPYTRIDEMYHDINPLYYWFRISTIDENYIRSEPDNSYRVYKWEDGKLTEIRVDGDDVISTELGYIHYQKRKIIKLFRGIKNSIIFSPDGIYDGEIVEEITAGWIRKHAKHKLFYKQYFKLRWNNLKYKVRHIRKYL